MILKDGKLAIGINKSHSWKIIIFKWVWFATTFASFTFASKHEIYFFLASPVDRHAIADLKKSSWIVFDYKQIGYTFFRSSTKCSWWIHAKSNHFKGLPWSFSKNNIFSNFNQIYQMQNKCQIKFQKEKKPLPLNFY